MLGGLTGCETSTASGRAARLAAHAEEFAHLTPSARAQVRAGQLRDGDTFEMVYLAIGTPDRVETAADGDETLWIYKKFYQEIAINGAELFPRGRKSGLAPFPAGKRPDYIPPWLAPLRGSSLTVDEYARENSRNGVELPKPPRDGASLEPPPLPFVELEILFRGRQVAGIAVLRDGLGG